MKKHERHGLTNTKEFNVWYGMIRRCTDPKHHNYKRYAERGIKVSDSWLIFTNFLADMGKVPKGKTLDRIDNNSDYCKENCRWADSSTQATNRSNSKFLTYNGETMPAAHFARMFNIKQSTLLQRVFAYGWDIERALKEPVIKGKNQTYNQQQSVTASKGIR